MNREAARGSKSSFICKQCANTDPCIPTVGHRCYPPHFSSGEREAEMKHIMKNTCEGYSSANHWWFWFGGALPFIDVLLNSLAGQKNPLKVSFWPKNIIFLGKAGAGVSAGWPECFIQTFPFIRGLFSHFFWLKTKIRIFHFRIFWHSKLIFIFFFSCNLCQIQEIMSPLPKTAFLSE